MPDHSMLMRAFAEFDIPHQRLAVAIDYIEANMEPDKAAHAIELLHAAISPAYSAKRHREAAASTEVAPVEPVAEVEAEPEAHEAHEAHDKHEADEAHPKPHKAGRGKAKPAV